MEQVAAWIDRVLGSSGDAATIAAVRGIEPRLLELARVLQMSFAERMRKVAGDRAADGFLALLALLRDDLLVGVGDEFRVVEFLVDAGDVGVGFRKLLLKPRAFRRVVVRFPFGYPAVTEQAPIDDAGWRLLPDTGRVPVGARLPVLREAGIHPGDAND